MDWLTTFGIALAILLARVVEAVAACLLAGRPAGLLSPEPNPPDPLESGGPLGHQAGPQWAPLACWPHAARLSAAWYPPGRQTTRPTKYAAARGDRQDGHSRAPATSTSPVYFAGFRLG